ncbi:MAG TPA: endonuclease/exonuclease/phosphatase family protein [Saprospiraceae bacterium]|nr:endonuclease/exonuclease/phosphatase family protein [Saprospiraceae bacterium]
MRWINALLVLLTLAAYLSPWVDPTYFWPISVLGLLYPWLLLGNLLFVLFWGFMRKKYLLLSLACILLGWKHLNNFIGLPGGTSQEVGVASGALLQVMSFNSFGFQLQDDARNRRLSSPELKQALSFDGYDLVLIQEFPTSGATTYPADHILENSDLKYTNASRGHSLAIFSHYPIVGQGEHYFENGYNGFQWVDVALGDTILRVFNVHLQSNAVSMLAKRVAEEGNIQEKKTWLDIKGMILRYRNAVEKRTNQAKEVVKEVAKSPYPVLIGGDFNDTPLSYMYHTVSPHLTDHFSEKGRGLGITYHGKVPALRIDYLFSSPGIEVVKHQIGKPNFSDHLPVISTIQLP